MQPIAGKGARCARNTHWRQNGPARLSLREGLRRCCARDLLHKELVARVVLSIAFADRACFFFAGVNVALHFASVLQCQESFFATLVNHCALVSRRD